MLVYTAMLKYTAMLGQTLANIFTNVKNANKFLNQNKATAVYIAVMEVFLVRQFSKTKNIANGQKTKKPSH